MSHGKDSGGNRFAKHPVLTIVFIVIAGAFFLDFTAAGIYKIVNGYSWNESLWVHSPVETGYRIRSGVYHHDLAKNKCVPNARYRNFTYRVFTNSLGFKDKMVRDIPRTSGAYRILFIGDSFSEGIGFSYEDTFVGLIDSVLSKKGIEVFNAAVCSYSPSIYWRKIKYLIEDEGFRFNEAVVFLDVSDISDEAITYCTDEDGNIVAKDKSEYLDAARTFNKVGDLNLARRILNNIKLIVIDNSMFIYPGLNILRARLNAYGHKGFAMEYYWTVDRKAFDEYGQKGLEKAARYMDKLNGLLKKNYIKLTVCVYPWPQMVAYGTRGSVQESFWRDWCKRNNAGFLDYFPVFIDGRSQEERDRMIDMYYSEGDCHWNRRGHQLVADAFLEYYNDRSMRQGSDLPVGR